MPRPVLAAAEPANCSENCLETPGPSLPLFKYRPSVCTSTGGMPQAASLKAEPSLCGPQPYPPWGLYLIHRASVTGGGLVVMS